LTEWTATNQSCTIDQTSVAEGIGGVLATQASSVVKLVNTRQTYVQGLSNVNGTASGTPNTTTVGVTDVSSPKCIRRYQINFAFGMFTQDKYIPTKYMASQFAIELTLAPEVSCIIANPQPQPSAYASTGTPTYRVFNCNLIPELLEFDEQYDQSFLLGLAQGGVPIKFSTWHTYTFTIGGQSNVNLQVQERSRSVKALFAIQRRAPEILTADSHTGFFETAGGSLQSYQFRIGGHYYPAAPVQTALSMSSAVPNGGCEALVELHKALNVVGDYRLSTGINPLRWAIPYQTTANIAIGSTLAITEADYQVEITGFNANGSAVSATVDYPQHGNVGSSCFAMAIDLESSNGVEISGLNAQEQVIKFNFRVILL